MKSLKLLIVPAVFAAFTTRPAQAQKLFSEGKIIYDVAVDLPASQQQVADMFKGSTLTMSIKNYMTRTDMHTSMISNSTILDTKNHTAVTLMEAGDNKYLVRLTKDELDKQTARFNGVSFTPQTGTKTIAGFACKQAVGKLSDGSTFSVYYTPDLMPENADYSKQFNGLKGLPLQFEMTAHNGLKMTLTANNVDLSPVPASVFDVPSSGYRELTPDEVRQMMGGQH